MEYYKFLKDINHCKKGDVIETKKANKLLKSWLEKKIVSKITKSKK